MTRLFFAALLAMSCGSTVISSKGLSTACTVDADCVAVYLGDVCGVCDCPNAAIAASSKASYDTEVSDAQKLCGPRTAIACDCIQVSAGCSSGTCVKKTP
jgi:hypothetical protein